MRKRQTRPWSAQEDEALEVKVKIARAWTFIAKDHRRSIAEVKARAFLLGYANAKGEACRAATNRARAIPSVDGA